MLIKDKINTQKNILSWYSVNKRDLPWRKNISFYRVWISEIILQQTQVKQGLDYYLRFIERFPDVKALAEADEKEVLNMWQGLGYYTRAINLHKGSKQVMNDFDGKFPKTYDDIKKIKGIGDYTAAAISSIVYNLPHAVLDGNVFRVLSRINADTTPINTTSGKKHFEKLANDFLYKENAGDFNQAMMEIGALVCKPQNPNCEICPIMKFCDGKTNANNFPVKTSKVKIKTRYFNYFIIRNGNEILIGKRGENDIYKNMYEPLLIESDKFIEDEMVLKQKIKEKYDIKDVDLTLYFEMNKHILTHQTIYFKSYILNTNIKNLKSEIFNKYFFVNVKEVVDYPHSKIVEKIFSHL